MPALGPGAPDHPDPGTVKESFALVEQMIDGAMTYFYSHLFAASPQIHAMFPPAMNAQRERLFRGIARIVWSQDSPQALTSYLAELGRAHRKFGVTPEHYDAFRRALVATMRRYSGPAWSQETRGAWEAMFDQAARIMIDAAAEDARHAPPWWLAEITGHELRAPGLAVLTLLPSQPLSYLPGQHVTVQTTRWPRVWRKFSVAGAPREDGQLSLHVRAVPGGLVSTALVQHSRVGDVLLLGPAGGTMTVGTGSERDVLCIAGGTGLAPVKAVIEGIIGSYAPAGGSGEARSVPPGHALAGGSGGARSVVPPGQQRAINLFFGTRRESDLYDMPDLRRLESGYPWLRVIPVVSDEPGFGGLCGTLPEVIRRHEPWAGHDVYVSGPDEMIRETVHVLTHLGAPADLIHCDLPPCPPDVTPSC